VLSNSLAKEDLNMAGYNYGMGMSNNAVDAYNTGLVPASKIKGIPVSLIRKHCNAAEWHHSSKFYNEIDFFDKEEVLATFGKIKSDEYEADENAILDLNDYKSNLKNLKVKKYTNCEVKWLEWYGTRNHPKCSERSEKNCTVVVKNLTATITLVSGVTFKKRLTTNGFNFTVFDE
jgi:hypothetical protein